MKEKKRCPWVNLDNPIYVTYHDKEWGRVVRDDHRLFEMLTLEGAQAGLSWETILKKRDNYRALFAGFDPAKVVRFSEAKIQKLLLDPGIVRHEGKIRSTISNAKQFIEIQNEFGSFSDYLRHFTNGKQIKNHFKTLKDYPSRSPLSDQISKDLKRRGFSFVGSTIIYAFMQAVGIVDDHTVDCFRRFGS